MLTGPHTPFFGSAGARYCRRPSRRGTRTEPKAARFSLLGAYQVDTPR
jgi:hypothetical protein